MPDFNGTIQLDDGDGLETILTVDSGRLIAKAGEHEIGNWAVEELEMERRNGEFRIKVEGEELIVGVEDPVGLSQILGVREEEPKRRRSQKTKAPKLKRKERSSPDVNPPPAASPASVVPAPVSVAEPASVAATGEVQAADGPSLWQRIPMRTKMIGLVVIALVVFFLLAPNLLALLLVLAGVSTLFLAIAAKDESGSRILAPPFFATTTAIAGGIGSVVLGLAIMVIT